MKIPSSQIPQVQSQQAVASANINMPAKDEAPVSSAAETAGGVDEALEPAAVYEPSGEEKPNPLYTDVDKVAAKSTDTTAKQPPKYSGGITTVWLDEKQPQYYKEPQSSNTYFYEQAFEFFRTPGDEGSYWENHEAFTASLDIARQELADQIAAGKGDSLDTLTAKVKIAPGMEMTLAEIQSVYEVCKRATENVEGCMKRSVQGEEFAPLFTMASMSVRKGLMDSGLSQEIVDFAAGIYHDRAMKVVENVNKIKPSTMQKQDFDPAVHTGAKYYDYYFAQINYDIHDENSISHDVYNKLMDIDVSSDEAFEKEFSEFYQWYHGQMELLTQLYPQWGDADRHSEFWLNLKDMFFK